ncbi:alpha/beta hydrolase [Microbacterium sp. zg.Y625]|uniref:alpha/beta hydrolase family protein n=1 Tax=Microbacterium jiangjiandongii TaxID=3049071 RepID=UPI00214B283F|nr:MULTISPECIES: alpha/beta hydrolase [unclassified Microbacterium]MCR2792753.1 alpha/beta hydrolase [Microbacterium sp. zg.Y625]WIM26731.1 alpha/beta hydrolase [Microbacterium sp. zg-Y625]
MIAIVTAATAALAAIAASLLRLLVRRVVGVEPRRKTLTVRRIGDDIEMPKSALTLADGSYGLWFGERFEHHALIGPVTASDEHSVIRPVLRTTAPISTEPFEAQWTGHVMSGPAEIDPEWEDVTVPLRDGLLAPAWLFRGDSPDAPWVIHVQGIRTSRLVTLRSVEVAQSAGLTSLVITYRGSGDGPPAPASTLGQREWTDLSDSIAYARACGATSIYVVAWSMGAGLALELLRHEPDAFDRLVLIAPATNWRRIIRHRVRDAGLPAFAGAVVTWALGSRVASQLMGLPELLDLDRLDWGQSLKMNVPAIAVHSRGDAEIPFEITNDFIAAHRNVTLVETGAAPHGWEANVDPELFRSALTAWFAGPAAADVCR